MNTTKQYGPKTDRALRLWIKLARAAATFGALTHTDIRRYGLTPPQFSVLESLGHLGPMTHSELCKKQLVTGGNMTVVVDNLEEEGLVERMRSPKDRRQVVVRLTAKGQRLFREIFVQHAKHVTELASVLTEKEQEELGRLLKKLGVTLQQRERT
jgi:MarR family 2-MHQ and catechol resistance regulon transcriptional repressor